MTDSLDTDAVAIEEPSAIPEVEPSDVHISNAPRRLARRFFFWPLLVVGLVCLLLAITAIWVDRTFTNTDEFVQTTKQVLSRDDVQDLIISRVTNEIMALPEVQDAITDWLPDQLDAFRDLIENAIRTGITRLLTMVMDSNVAQELLDSALEVALRSMHEQLMNGQDVSVGLTDLIGLLDFDPKSLVGKAANAIPETFGRVVILRKSEAPELYTAVQVGSNAWKWTSLAAGLFILAAFAIAVDKRKAMMAIGYGASITALVGLFGLWIGGDVGVSRVPPEFAGVVNSASDVFTQSYEKALWRWLIAGLIVGTLALLLPWLRRIAESSGRAGAKMIQHAARRGIDISGDAASGISKAVKESRDNPSVQDFPQKLKRGAEVLLNNPTMFRWGVAVVAALLWLVWPAHSFLTFFVFLVLAFLVIGIYQLARAGTGHEDSWSSFESWLRPKRDNAQHLWRGAAKGFGKDPVAGRVGELERLVALADAGALSKKEFKQAKAEILGAEAATGRPKSAKRKSAKAKTGKAKAP